jgi:predicted SnoaL-like aldol condensation-catalyzing enzyme
VDSLDASGMANSNMLKKIIDMSTAENNKATVIRFNKEFIEGGSADAFNEIMDPGFINQSAPPGVPTGPEGVMYFFDHFLKPSFPDLKVEILKQVAEGDTVTTHKKFYATHSGEFMGIPATGKKVEMEIIDILRLKDGKLTEHWNVLDWYQVIQQLNN